MDWNASGIVNSFEYELVDPFQLDLSYGFLEGVVSGSITESYRGDYRATAILNFDGELPPLRPLIRVWHVAELDGETVREELGTFTQGAPLFKYRNGRKVGSVELYSAMYRLGGDLSSQAEEVPAGTVIASRFRKVVTDAGCTPWVHPAINETATSSAKRVREVGTSALSECHECASELGGMVNVDSRGRVTLDVYQEPSIRSDSFAIDTESAAISRDGLSVTTSDWYNCAVVSTIVDNEEFVGVAKVDESDPLHMRRIGYWKTDYTIMDNPPTSNVQTAVSNAAKARLREVTKKADVYSASMLYRPIKCGEVGTFWYQDSDDDGMFVRGLVTQREINLDPVMSMMLTLEEVK